MWSAIFPPLCLGCERLLPLRRPTATHDDALALCSRCLLEQGRLPTSLQIGEGIHALFPYEGPLARAVVSLKFGGALALAGPLGRLLAQELASSRGRWDRVIPVPLHWRRRLRRGFDQAEELARWALHPRHCPDRTGLPILATRVLRRRRATQAQTELDAEERAANVDGAFVVRDSARVVGRRILLIDDVTTTGATLRECQRVLLDAGATEVGALVLLRTL